MKPTPALRNFLSGSSFPTAIAVFCLLNSSSHAGTTWDGGSGVDSRTSTAANWNGDVRPNSAASLQFNGTVRNTVIWDGINSVAPVNINGMTFGAGAGAFILNAGTQSNIQFVANSTATIQNNSSNIATLNVEAAVFFTGTKTFDANTAGLALSGGIVFRGDSMTSGHINRLDLIGTANGTTTTIGRVGGFAAGTDTSLVKNGSGKWTVTGNVTDTGTVTISGGTLEYQGSVSSSSITNNSALIFNNAGTQSYANVISGSGTLTKNGAGSFTLANANTYIGTTTISNGTLSAGKIVVSSGNSSLGNAATAVTLGSAGSQGTLSYTGNTAAYTRGFTIGGAGGGRLDVTTSGQTLTVQTGNVTGTGLFTVGGAGDTSIASNLTHTGGLTKADAGTLTLTGTNTYTGDTTVSAGVLAVNGSLGNTSTTIQSGGTLQGSGTIAGSVTVEGNGTLAPGNSIESLGTGALSFLASSTYAYELQTNLYASTPNLAGDLTYTTSTLDITSGAILTLTDLAASTVLADGSKLTLISYGSGWTGTELFTYLGSPLADNSTFTLGANQWFFDYNDTVEGMNFATESPNGQSYVTMTVIPEPRAALLGSLGLLALLRRRRN